MGMAALSLCPLTAEGLTMGIDLERRLQRLEAVPDAAAHPGLAEAQRRAADLLSQPSELETPEAEQEAEQRAGRRLAALLKHLREGRA